MGLTDKGGIDFSQLFHQSSKRHQKGDEKIPANPADWPDEWKTTFYKTYPRLPKIDLRGEPPRIDFFDLIKKRKSRRSFTRGTVTKNELSLLLEYSCGITGRLSDGRYRRAQPSGGARFPLEVYPIVFRSSGACGAPNSELKAGLYHYNVKHHQLDLLWDRSFSDEDIMSVFTYPWVKDAALCVVMTAVFWRNQNKYGERGYRYILQEAGHVGQNLYLVAEALKLKCCALGGTRDEALEKLIDIDGVAESVVYAVAVGK
jgi:SagB-type dehydrogenase family enzyme